MKFVYIIIFFLSVYSCTTQRKVEKYLNNNKEFASSYCADEFKINTDTIRLYEIDTFRYDHYINSIDTIIIDTTDTKEKIITKIKYQIKEIIKNTPPLTITKIIEKENTARVENLTIIKNKLTSQIDDLNKRVNQLTRFRNITFFFLFILSLLLLIYMYIKYRLK